MSSSRHLHFTPLDIPTPLPNPPTTDPQTLYPSLTSYDTDLLMAQVTPPAHSSPLQHSEQLRLFSSFQIAMDNIQQQIQSLSAQLAHLTSSRLPAIRSAPVNIDSRPSSSHSIRVDHSVDPLSEHFLRVEAEYHRLQRELAHRSQLNNNNVPISHVTNSLPLPSNILPSTAIPPSSLPCYATYSSINPQSLSRCPSSSAFQPITKLLSPALPVVPVPVIAQPHSLPSSVVNNNSVSIPPAIPSAVPSKSLVHVPPIIPSSAPTIINSNDIIPPPTKPSLPSSITTPPHSTLPPPFTMTINNNLPTFKGLAHEKPIQFINDFEIRASALVGDNDSLLLQTVRQVLSDGAVTWFGQLQTSQDRITTWIDFKTRFYERYHTPAQIQHLRIELRLLFQGDNERTLDYFERLKTLMIEIDPECSDNWLKHKFIQKLRSDIRSRLDVNINLPVRELVRKVQNIETNIEQQKIDEKLKLAAHQEKKNMPSVTTNNLSINNNGRRPSLHLSSTYSSSPSSNNDYVNHNISTHPSDQLHSSSNTSTIHSHHFNNRNNFNYSSNNSNNYSRNNNQYNRSSRDQNFLVSPQHQDINYNSKNNNMRRNYSHSNNMNNQCYSPTNHTRPISNLNTTSNTQSRQNQLSSITSRTNNRSSDDKKIRWWCPHCQRHGHSWERCPSNPNSINYRRNSSSNYPSLSAPGPPQSSSVMDEETLSSFPSPSLSSTLPPIPSASSNTIIEPINLPPLPLTISSTLQSSSSSDLLPSSQPTSNLSISQPTPHSSRSTGFITPPHYFNSSDHYPHDCYLTAEAKINDIPGIVSLDTGSGPDGSSIGPEGQVIVHITMAGATTQHPAILAKHFHHLILLGNDYMKSIGLVLDLQANKMWLRQHPERSYSISSDLTQAGRIDVPVISTERRIIAPYHIAYIQVNVPSSLLSHSWDASITSHRSNIATANSLIRFTDCKSFVQIANCTARQQQVNSGEYVALADLYLGGFDSTSDVYPMSSSPSNSSSLSSWESPTPISTEGFYLNSSSTDYESPTIDTDQQQHDSSTSQSHLNSSLPPQTHTFFNTQQPSIINTSLTSTSSHKFSSSSSNINLPTATIRDTSSLSNIDFLQSFNVTDTDLNENELIQLKNLLITYRTCFNDKPGRISVTQHHIDTGTTKPIKLRPYRVSPQRQQIISQHINQMLTDDIIELANGPYAAPVTLQPKKDGSLRFCLDFRQLNSVTVRDVYPIPRIDDTLDQLQTAKYFTSLNLKSGFWQIELDDESRPKTAFITHAGLFQFKVMPFGLTNAPATFQRLMDLILGGLKWSCALVYLDDIIVYSPTFQLHLKHLESVLQHIQASGLILHISKCQFCKTKIKYLGHVVSQSGIEPDPDKIRAVRDYSVPTRLKEVRTFLGLTSYYRRFIKKYATIAEPLTSLTRNADNKSFIWTPSCQQAFLHLRQLLIEAPVISYPHFDQPFILQVDASDVGLSAILAQKLPDADGVQREHVIGYASRTLSPIERRYSPTERECLAIVYGCSHFRPYLEGVHFTILTDHKALKWLHRTKDLNSRLARWAMQIAAYDVDIQHRSGTDNANCDALSRALVDELSSFPHEPTTQDVNPINILHDPVRELLLDYFHHSSLSPPQLIIPISLNNNTNIIDQSSHFTLPFSPTLLANLHFATKTQLYEDIRDAQWQDPELLPLLNYLQHQQLPEDNTSSKILALASSHRVVDGALYRILRPSSTFTDISSSIIDFSTHLFLHPQQQLRLIVPKSKIRELLSLAHDHPTAAHLGRRKTLFRLSSRFIWPHMRRDVIAYVRSCMLCQQYKPSNQPSGGLMKPIVIHEPWNTVGIDLTGPLPKTRRGNSYILVVIDYFTKWVELFPLANTKAKTIAQLFLDEVICRFGFPVRIISDNGVQFLSSIFTNVCQTLGIKHQRTPLYHPQSNLCERVNRTLKPLLAALAHHDTKSWDLKLAQIAFALRTAPSDSTEQSPAFLMFGRHPRQPLDLCLPSPTTMETPPTTDDLSNYRKRLLADLLPAYANTRELLDISHQRQTQQYNKHHRDLHFEPGDLVWVTALSGVAMGKWRGKKLSPRREGPYRVVQRLSSLTYSLEHTLTGQQLTPIHVNRLERYYSYNTID
ncbi:unnamed protein product [Rotaria sp. Silwood2]|nr:unnamed protein product [Rotaria sp. Silwood2]